MDWYTSVGVAEEPTSAQKMTGKMAQIGISEFSYGFAFLHEQCKAHWPQITAAPILPNLRQEADEGWDARLPLKGTIFFYQFKLSEIMSRRNSKFIADGTYASPYFKIKLHRGHRNRQHSRLRSLSQMQSNTFYVAPEITNLSDFNEAFIHHQVVQHSRLIHVSQCPDINDGDQHWISFQQGETDWIFHSAAQRGREDFSGRELEQLYASTQKEWERVDHEFASRFLEAARTVIFRCQDEEGVPTTMIGPTAPSGGTTEILGRAADVLATFFGVTTVLVGERRRSR